MAVNMQEDKMLDYILRALQLIFAFIVMGTDGYAIHEFRPHNTLTNLLGSDVYLHVGVPDSWGFLMFCAGWTVVIVISHGITGSKFAAYVWMRYLYVAAEGVALLSWLAGFVAVAVRISGNECSTGEKSCGSLIVATVFGALECLLFTLTASFMTSLVALNSHRTQKTFVDKRVASV